jgi:hypothetical protein
METYIFNIASHYASAIVNNDYTGLDDNEEKELNGFLDHLQRQYGNAYLIWNGAESDYNRCDVSNLMGDCLQFNLEVK